MITDIHIKTYTGDYDWIPYCLRCIEKFATNYRKVVLVTDYGQEGELISIVKDTVSDRIPVSIRTEKVSRGIPMNEPIPGRVTVGYQFMKGAKFLWTKHTDADRVFQIDSDMMICAPIDLSRQTVWHQARWQCLPNRYLDDIQCNWEGIKRFSGSRLYPWSNMFRPGWWLTRPATEGFCEYLRTTFGSNLPVDFFMDDSLPNMSAYHCFGIYLQNLDIDHALSRYRCRVKAANEVTTTGEGGEYKFTRITDPDYRNSPNGWIKDFRYPIRVFHSWSGLSEGNINQIEGILADG